MKTQSKQAFILAQDNNIPADQVVKAAKKLGLKISRAYVYVTRSNAKRGVTKSTNAKARAPRLPDDVRVQFGTLALRIGLDRASAELDRLRGRMDVV